MIGLSTIIEGTNQQVIRGVVNKLRGECGISDLNGPDAMTISNPGKPIRIEDSRKALNFLKIKPLNSKSKLLIIEDAQNLTLDAQNALLKTLEEPSSTSTIVLICDNADNLIPTIVSRCKRFKAQEIFVSDPKLVVLAEKFLVGGVGERLSLIEDNKDVFSDRTEAIKFVDNLASVARQKMNKTGVEFINRLLKVQKDLSQTNVNVRLALEYLAMI